MTVIVVAKNDQQEFDDDQAGSGRVTSVQKKRHCIQERETEEISYSF